MREPSTGRSRLFHRLVLVACCCVIATACESSVGPAEEQDVRFPPTTRAAEGSVPGTGGPPRPDAAIPTDSDAFADSLSATTDALRSEIERWVSQGDLHSPQPPRSVALWALHQQRHYQALTANARLRRQVLARLPRELRGQARANAIAGAKLRSLVTPISGPSGFRIQRPESAGALRGYYDEAERRFGVDWEVLAAVNFVESKFGRVSSPSSAGARGPMQFIPSTWDAYGLGGDVDDPYDAILGAANYLSAGGAPERYRRALYAYNHSFAYVDAILLYARQIMRDPNAYLAYYNWQLFVLTTDGLRQLTGPGADPERGS